MRLGLQCEALTLMNQLLCLHLLVNWLSIRVSLSPPPGVESCICLEGRVVLW